MPKPSPSIPKSLPIPAWALALAAVSFTAEAGAQTVPPQAQAGAANGSNVEGAAGSLQQLEEIVVTAEKRSESINDVGMSINALSGAQLQELGITNVADLAKAVPGFNYTTTFYGTPVYTIRGVGFQENSLAASPAVSVYVDEVPIPFSVETVAAALDLERVEVLKGPQGTLFGTNSTGGAVNYIAAKPTDKFTAGVNGTYGRFNSLDLAGFVSGPLTDTLRARVAMDYQYSGDWQQSYTRPATLGARKQVEGRLLLDWQPVEALVVAVNFNGWFDKSDTPAGQLIGITPGVPPVGLPPGFANYPLAPANARAADWDPGVSFRRNNNFYQGSVRADYTLSNDLTLTSISSYEEYRRYQPMDGDGTAYQGFLAVMSGDVKTFFQELRLSGKLGGPQGHWMLGANYQHDQTADHALLNIADSSNRVIAGVPTHAVLGLSNQDTRTKAVYGNVDYDILPAVTALAGVRYTKSDRDFTGCAADPGDGSGVALFNAIRGLAGVPPQNLAPGSCQTLDRNLQSGPVRDTLDESNTSWRAGLNYKPVNDLLLYGNISKGYKSGSFPTLSGVSVAQYVPVTQESLLAYELGTKATLLDRTLQLNASVFYYDYKNKQIRGRIVDPVFGPLEALLNIPKSHVIGFEVDGTWRPIQGLRIAPSISLVNSRLDSEPTRPAFDPLTRPVLITGERFPYTPKWSGNVDVEYRRGLSSVFDGYVGANVSYQGETNGGFGDLPEFRIREYTLLGLRAGVANADDRWRVGVYVNNVTDRYYWVTATEGIDTGIRYAGLPRTYGVSFGYSFK